jgi:hypothetical protein
MQRGAETNKQQYTSKSMSSTASLAISSLDDPAPLLMPRIPLRIRSFVVVAATVLCRASALQKTKMSNRARGVPHLCMDTNRSSHINWRGGLHGATRELQANMRSLLVLSALSRRGILERCQADSAIRGESNAQTERNKKAP